MAKKSRKGIANDWLEAHGFSQADISFITDLIRKEIIDDKTKRKDIWKEIRKQGRG